MAGGGGKGGGSKGEQATAGGGVSPQQMAFAQYTFGENEVKNAQTFAGTPMSTGLTQADAGAFAGEVHDLGSMSDKDAKAMAGFIDQQNQQAKQGITQVAGGLGSLAGGGGGGGVG